jgi:hypothetical protein
LDKIWAIQFLFSALLVKGEKKMKNNNITGGILVLAVMLSLVLGCKQTQKIEVNGGELSYTTNVTKAEAETLAYYLVEGNFFDGQRKSVQLDKSDSTYQFRMVVKPEFRNDKSYHKLAKQFARELSANVFDDEPVEVHICDERFETVRVIKP